MAEETEGRKVPRSVLLVALLALALGIVIEVSYYAVTTGNDDFINSFTMLSTQNTSLLAYISTFFMWMFFVMFIGLIYLRGWGRVLVMVVGLPGIVIYSFKSIIIFSSMIGDEGDATKVIVLASSIGAIAVAMMAVWYMSRPNVILAFEAQEVVLIKRKIGAIERKIYLGKQRCNAGEMSKSELAKLRADCLAKEKVLRGRIRHLDKVRLARERKQKEAEDRAVERWEEKQAKKEKKAAEKEERKAEKELEKEEKEKGDDEESAEEKDSAKENHAGKKNRKS